MFEIDRTMTAGNRIYFWNLEISSTQRPDWSALALHAMHHARNRLSLFTWRRSYITESQSCRGVMLCVGYTIWQLKHKLAARWQSANTRSTGRWGKWTVRRRQSDRRPDCMACSHMQCSHVLLTRSQNVDDVIISASTTYAPHGSTRRPTFRCLNSISTTA